MVPTKFALLIIASADIYCHVTSLPGKHIETLRITGIYTFSIF
jgi:hypothetical protein